MKKFLIILSLSLAWCFPVQAQSTAQQVQPGYLSSTGCPGSQHTCFIPYSSVNPLPVTASAASFLCPSCTGGELLIGNSSGGFSINKLTQGSGITITNGNGTITIASTGGGGTGTVTTVSCVTANGVSCTVANPTTTPALTFTLGAITPSSVNGITISNSNAPTWTIGSASGVPVVTASSPLVITGTTGNITCPTCAVTASSVASFSAGTTGFTPNSATTGAVTLAGTLIVANGGTNCSAASITCFNNITGFTTAGTTGTTSTNLVFSTSPTLITPVLGVATATSIAIGGGSIGTDNLEVTGTSTLNGNLAVVGQTNGATTITVTGITSGNALLANTVTTGTGISCTGLTTGNCVNATMTTTGQGIQVNATSATATTSSAILVTGSANMTSDYTGAYINVSPTKNMTPAATRAFSGNMLSINPTYSITGSAASIYNMSGATANFTRVLSNGSSSGSSSLNISGAVVAISSPAPTRTNPVVNTANVLTVTQSDTQGSGTAFTVSTAGTGAAATFTGGKVGIGTATPLAQLDMSATTDALAVPSGTTGTRPATGINGMLRYSQTNNAIEAYINNSWATLATAGTITLTGAVTGSGTSSIATTFATVSDKTILSNISGGSAASQANNAATVGASWVLIGTGVASSSASISFTSIPSTYDQYVFIISNAIPASNAVNFLMTISEDNGSSYKSASYNWGGHGSVTSSGSLGSGGATAQSFLQLNDNTISSTANIGIDAVIWYNSLGSSTLYKRYKGQVTYLNSAGPTDEGDEIFGRYTGDTGAINAVKFAFSSGNIASGNFALYGIRNQ